MTIHLPGNPHAEDFRRSVAEFGESTIGVEGLTDATIIWEGLRQLGEATMALAYEQRTANLISRSSLNAQFGYIDELGELRRIDLRLGDQP